MPSFDSDRRSVFLARGPEDSEIMLIMNSRKMIYVHLQKCGGTSIERAFYEKCQWNDVLIGSSLMGEIIQWGYFGKFGLHKHSAAKVVKRVVGDAFWNDCFSWATVRNPFSRTASLYNFAATLVKRHAADVALPPDAPPATWTMWAQSQEYPTTEPWSYAAVKAFLLSRSSDQPFSAFLRNPFLAEDDAFSPQWWGVQDEDGVGVAVDQIVRLENLASSWPTICHRIGLPDLQLEWANASNPGIARPAKDLFMSADDIDFVARRFHEDFLAFGYDEKYVL